MVEATASEGAGEPFVIRPGSRWGGLNVRELWDYRELLFFLTWRDLKVRYKQTVLGASWAILQPFFVMVVFSVFFGRLAGLPSEGVPYPIFAYAGLIPWLFFANTVQFSSNSLVGNSSLISKVYFPRLIAAVAPVLAGLVDFLLAFGVLVALMVVYDVYPDPVRLLALAPLVALVVVAAAGIGIWLAALNVRYRDVRFVVPFLIQLWLFATPVVYPASLLDEPWRTVYGLNPMVGVVEGFRWALIDAGSAPGAMLALSAGVAAFALVVGALYFRKIEQSFADVI